jgi:hypothetical protein
MNEDAVIAALKRLFPLKADATDRQKKTVQEQQTQIITCMMAPDIAKFIGTRWGFLNAVADYVDHCDPVRKTKNWQESRFASVVGGHPLLNAAYQIAGVPA